MKIVIFFSALVIFRTFLLWEQRLEIPWLLIAGSVLVNTVAVVSIGQEVKVMNSKSLRLCTLPNGIEFDVLV